MGYYFGLWARCLSDELKKKICNDCHVASPALVGEEKESPQQIYGGGKRCLAPTAANLRLGGSAVALLQLRANSHTLKRRRADSSRPLER